MKRKLVLSLIATTILTFGLIGCNNKENINNNETIVDSQTQEEIKNEEVEAVSSELDVENEEVEDSKPEKEELKPYSYDRDSKPVFDMTEDEVIKALGTPTSIEEDTLFDSPEPDAKYLRYEDMSVFFYEGKIAGLANISSNGMNHIRGIKIGDTLESVLNKFPSELTKDSKRYDYDIEYEHKKDVELEYAIIYGEYYHRKDFGVIVYEKGTDNVVAVSLGDEGTRIEIFINSKDNKVTSIDYGMSIT